jgi:para-aminobenzoate synthetase component 1
MPNKPQNVIFLKGNDRSASWDDEIMIAIDEDNIPDSINKYNISDLKSSFPDFGEETWKFGYLSYDFKNKLEQLHSRTPSFLNVQEFCFLNPGFIWKQKGENKEVVLNKYDYDSTRINEILRKYTTIPTSSPLSALAVRPRLSRKAYLKQVMRIQERIRLGDIYELNFCMEFFAEDVDLDPFAVYKRLNDVSDAPFSAFCRFGDLYIISASPERFLKKSGSHLLSQPIKGTRRRGNSAEEDEQLRKELLNDEKERSENVMIVDLVRNDLSRVAQKGSVKVDELFGIYSFPQVHQMISTVSCELNPTASFYDIIKATFPMGSMTGAPKVRAMELIDEFENSRRGLYSGAVGYITPQGDFDFSVIIRTILYDSKQRRLSFSVGSAITSLSDPEKEYEECLLKAKALIDALNAKIVNE